MTDRVGRSQALSLQAPQNDVSPLKLLRIKEPEGRHVARAEFFIEEEEGQFSFLSLADVSVSLAGCWTSSRLRNVGRALAVRAAEEAIQQTLQELSCKAPRSQAERNIIKLGLHRNFLAASNRLMLEMQPTRSPERPASSWVPPVTHMVLIIGMVCGMLYFSPLLTVYLHLPTCQDQRLAAATTALQAANATNKHLTANLTQQTVIAAQEMDRMTAYSDQLATNSSQLRTTIAKQEDGLQQLWGQHERNQQRNQQQQQEIQLLKDQLKRWQADALAANKAAFPVSWERLLLVLFLFMLLGRLAWYAVGWLSQQRQMQTQHDVKPQSDAAAAEAEGDLPAEQVELPQDEPVELVPTSADLIASEQEQIPELTPHSSPVRLCAADSLCLEGPVQPPTDAVSAAQPSLEGEGSQSAQQAALSAEQTSAPVPYPPPAQAAGSTSLAPSPNRGSTSCNAEAPVSLPPAAAEGLEQIGLGLATKVANLDFLTGRQLGPGLAALQDAWQIVPGKGQAISNIIRLHVANGDYTAAEKAIACVADIPGHADAVAKAQAYVADVRSIAQDLLWTYVRSRGGRAGLSLVLETLQAYTEHHPGYPITLRIAQADGMLRLGQYEEALRMVQEMELNLPKCCLEWAQAQCHFWQGRLPQAYSCVYDMCALLPSGGNQYAERYGSTMTNFDYPGCQHTSQSVQMIQECAELLREVDTCVRGSQSSFEQVERATEKHRLEGDPAAIQAARTMHVTVHQLRHLEPFVIPPAFLAAAFHELARQQALVGDLATAVRHAAIGLALNPRSLQGATRLAGLLTAMSQWSLTVKLLAVVKPSDTDGDEWQLLSDVQTQARINLVNGIVEDAAALLGLSSIAAEDRTAKQVDQASALCKDKMQEASDIKFPTVMLFSLMPNLEAEETVDAVVIVRDEYLDAIGRCKAALLHTVSAPP